MKDNREIITEAFFKKPSYSERLKKILPEYEPEDRKKVGTPGLVVSDASEAKKRLVNSFGAIVGNNTIKTMASKAIKTFPIVLSDNVDPETAVLIKRTVEEQYADYIQLLISNQIIDASEFVTGDDNSGNIAIQALDKISGADFSKRQGLATKADRGELNLNTIARNDLLYNLIRQESEEFNSGDEFTNALLEDSVILPKERSDMLIEYMLNNNDEILGEILKEDEENYVYTKDPRKVFDRRDKKKKFETLDNYLRSKRDGFGRPANNSASYKDDLKGAVDAKYSGDRQMGVGLLGSDLDSSSIWINPDKMDQAMDYRVKDILNDNPALKDRFEKATFLLYSYRITGYEYISYLQQRLGIPIPEKVRKELLLKYRADQLRSLDNRVDNSGKKIYTDNAFNGNKEAWAGLYTGAEAQAIANNVHLDYSKGFVHEITSLKYKDVLISLGVLAGGAALSAGGTAVAVALGAISAAAATPIFLAGLIPALAGSSIYLITKLIRNRKIKKERQFSIKAGAVYGWERVESLIKVLDMQRKDVQDAYEEATGLKEPVPDGIASSKELNNAIKKAGFTFSFNECASPFDLNVDTEREIKVYDDPIDEQHLMVGKIEVEDSILKESQEAIKETLQQLKEDQEYKSQVFTEAVISTTVPVKVVKKYEFDPKQPAEVSVVPEFSARNRKAYGEVEYDTRQIKDRRYNQPLIMRINFRERYSDGKLSDNEMTAVIGILGVVTRVPSEEMEVVLKANAEGQAIEGVFKPADKDKQNIASLFGLAKKNSKLSSLTTSELWQNLEKISKLAFINKLTGRHNNNISNAHLIFSQKEVDAVKAETGVDYLRDRKLLANLMKRYSAFSIMIVNDPGERIYIFDDLDSQGSLNVIPMSALRSRDGQDQLTAALMKLSDRR